MDHLLEAKKEHKNSKETGDSRYIYQNELDKSCCEHDMIYGDLNDLPRSSDLPNSSDKLLHDKAFNIAKNAKYDGYQGGLASKIYKFFDKKSSSSNTSVGAVKSEMMSNQGLAKELHKPIIGKFE